MNLAGLAPSWSLQRWLGLPGERVRLIRRFVGVALTLAAAKVFLNTVAFALFLANEGPAQLPRFYVLLALVAITLSAALGTVVDRVPKLPVARVTLVAAMVCAGAGKLMLAGEVTGAYFVILAVAFIFEIAIEILFWSACSAYVDTIELKRATPIICLAIALGGAFGGLLARMLSWTMDAPDLLLVMFIFASLAALQLAVPADFFELPEGHGGRATPGDLAARPTGLLRLGMRHPLLILIALNALMLTILYGIAEFLFLSVYSAHFPQEQELTRFLGMVFALLQACEFLLLARFSRILLERTSPLVRNLVFPLTSLACLLYLAFSGKLSAAVITHVNAEAASNAIFQPVHNANFLALPLGIQGRARTVSEGIFYPAGLAIAGTLLWSMDEAGAIAAANFVAVLFALVFIPLNVGVGLLFLPTLVSSLRSGAVSLAGLTGRIGLPAAAAERVREFLRSPLPELRLDGIALSRWLGPAHVADDLVALASHPDLPTRRALVRLALEGDRAWVRRFIEAAHDHGDLSSTFAMQVMLAHREALPAGQAAQLVRSGDPSGAALAALLVDGFDPDVALGHLTPMLRHPQVAADVIEGIVAADRADCAGIVLAALLTAPSDQQKLGLEFLRRSRARVVAASWRSLGRLARHHDLGVRAEATALLGECPHRAALGALRRRLADWSPRVRRRAAEALAAHGDPAVDLLCRQLVPTTPGSAEAARALSRMTSRHARHGLIRALRQLRRDARENARLLGRVAAAPEPGPWLGLVACAHDHKARIVELALAVLSESLQRHVFAQVRYALRSDDRRLRANAFEVLVSLPRSAVVAEAVEMLRFVLFEQPPEQAEAFDGGAVLALARTSRSPWVSEAARTVAERTPAKCHASPASAGRRRAGGPWSRDMNLNEQDLERVLVLKRAPLFAFLPLDTLLAVSRVLETRHYLAGAEIVTRGAAQDHLCILERGMVELVTRSGAERLEAPACFGEVVLLGEPPLFQRVVAIEDSTVLRLHRVIFHDLIQDHPDLGMELAKLLARRLRRLLEPPRPG